MTAEIEFIPRESLRVEFNQCNCCFDDIYEYIKCSHGHFICKDCAFAGVKNAVGENKKFKCTDPSICEGRYSHDDLLYCINNDVKLMESYNSIGTVVINNNERDPSIIYCCVPMVLHDGCNKLTCPTCKKLWCWICKKRIHSYDHFDRSGNDHQKCPLYNNKVQQQGCCQDWHEQHRVQLEQQRRRMDEEERIRRHREVIGQLRRQQQYLLLERQRKQERGMIMCNAIKRNGYPCSFKARNGHQYCGKHNE